MLVSESLTITPKAHTHIISINTRAHLYIPHCCFAYIHKCVTIAMENNTHTHTHQHFSLHAFKLR